MIEQKSASASAKLYSISRMLRMGVLSITVLYIAVVYVLSQRSAVHEIEELFDAQLAHSSNILFNLLGESVSTIDQNNKHLPIVYHGLESHAHTQTDDLPKMDELNALFYQKKVAYQIFNSQGKLLIKSNSAMDSPFADTQTGFSRIAVAGEIWRVYSMYDNDWDFWLHVAESESIRDELASDIAGHTLLPSILLLPVILLLLVFIIRFAMSPIKELASHINQRDPKNLSPILIDKTPIEVSPLLDAINDLFFRLQDAINREQRLTADAAHELRTPLAVVMIHAQNALAATTDEQRISALQELELGMQRIARLLEQLLTLSKINPETIPKLPIQLVPFLQNTLAQLAPKIYEKNQEIELLADESLSQVHVLGSEFLLEILMRNLVDNASAYCPVAGLIRITLNQHGEELCIQVEDSGQGVQADDFEKITQRFYRSQQNQQSGAGLGLSLVSSVCEFHDAKLSFFESTLGGLGVQVLIKSA